MVFGFDLRIYLFKFRNSIPFALRKIIILRRLAKSKPETKFMKIAVPSYNCFFEAFDVFFQQFIEICNFGPPPKISDSVILLKNDLLKDTHFDQISLLLVHTKTR